MAEYTKAQLTEMIIGKLQRNFGRTVEEATPNHMFKACALVPVSYTHLDVYKRQDKR